MGNDGKGKEKHATATRQGRGPQVGEIYNPLRLGNPLAHITSHFYHVYMIGGWGDHMRDYMARQVTSPTRGPPPPC